MKQIFRRKKSLVNKEIQFGFAWIICGYLVLYTLFMILMFGIPIWWIMSNTPGGEMDKMAAVGKFVIDDQTFWFLMAVFIVVITLHSITVTRKIAGPIFVFRQYLEKANSGEMSQIHLRKNDYLHDMKDLLNFHFDRLHDYCSEYQNTVDEMKSELVNFQESSSDKTESQTQFLNELSLKLEKLQDAKNKLFLSK